MILTEINKDLQDYGYEWVGMKEIKLDDACKLFGKQNIFSELFPLHIENITLFLCSTSLLKVIF